MLALQKDSIRIISEQLTNLGFTISSEYYPVVIASSKKLAVWIDLDNKHLAIGDKRTFDRWANSRDYYFEGLPETEEDLQLVFKIAEDCIQDGVVRGEDCIPIPLNQWWRKYKRERSKSQKIDDSNVA